jgi:hypothetical protein
VTNGLILLGFIALIFALILGRFRRRIGLPVTVRVLMIAITGFAIVVLVMWATSTK